MQPRQAGMLHRFERLKESHYAIYKQQAPNGTRDSKKMHTKRGRDKVNHHPHHTNPR
jgi:hypothetical protein